MEYEETRKDAPTERDEKQPAQNSEHAETKSNHKSPNEYQFQDFASI